MEFAHIESQQEAALDEILVLDVLALAQVSGGTASPVFD
jgi:hypothetical protein